jgi:hypothetical protein
MLAVSAGVVQLPDVAVVPSGAVQDVEFVDDQETVVVLPEFTEAGLAYTVTVGAA